MRLLWVICGHGEARSEQCQKPRWGGNEKQESNEGLSPKCNSSHTVYRASLPTLVAHAEPNPITMQKPGVPYAMQVLVPLDL